MQSLDVVHSLFLPNLRTKQDVVPGLRVPLWFETTRTTAQARASRSDPKFNYEIACAELCGLGHTKMRGLLRILTQSQYADWATQSSADAADYDRPEIWESWRFKKPKIGNKGKL